MAVKAETLPKTETLESPSSQIIKEARPVITVTDSRNRRIRYRAQSVLEQARLMRALGEHANNQAYMNLVNIAACVIDVDGEFGPPRSTIGHLEHRIEWLGDEGYAAIFVDAQKRADEMLEEADPDYRTELKNS